MRPIFTHLALMVRDLDAGASLHRDYSGAGVPGGNAVELGHGRPAGAGAPAQG